MEKVETRGEKVAKYVVGGVAVLISIGIGVGLYRKHGREREVKEREWEEEDRRRMEDEARRRREAAERQAADHRAYKEAEEAMKRSAAKAAAEAAAAKAAKAAVQAEFEAAEAKRAKFFAGVDQRVDAAINNTRRANDAMMRETIRRHDGDAKAAEDRRNQRFERSEVARAEVAADSLAQQRREDARWRAEKDAEFEPLRIHADWLAGITPSAEPAAPRAAQRDGASGAADETVGAADDPFARLSRFASNAG